MRPVAKFKIDSYSIWRYNYQISLEEKFKLLKDGLHRPYVYYSCAKGKDRSCSQPYINDIWPNTQASTTYKDSGQTCDIYGINKIGVRILRYSVSPLREIRPRNRHIRPIHNLQRVRTWIKKCIAHKTLHRRNQTNFHTQRLLDS